MTPIEEYILELLQSYVIWILVWTWDNFVILYYYLCSLTSIVLLEYIYLFFAGKKKTEIFCTRVKCENLFLFLGRTRGGEFVKKLSQRSKREERVVLEFISERHTRNHASLIARVNFFLIEIKSLYIRKFVQIVDGVFFLIGYIYVYIRFQGNMRIARMNPDVNTMLQMDTF